MLILRNAKSNYQQTKISVKQKNFIFSTALTKLPVYERIMSQLKRENTQCATAAGISLAAPATSATIIKSIHEKLQLNTVDPCLKSLEKESKIIQEAKANTKEENLLNQITKSYQGSQSTCDNGCKL